MILYRHKLELKTENNGIDEMLRKLLSQVYRLKQKLRFMQED